LSTELTKSSFPAILGYRHSGLNVDRNGVNRQYGKEDVKAISGPDCHEISGPDRIRRHRKYGASGDGGVQSRLGISDDGIGACVGVRAAKLPIRAANASRSIRKSCRDRNQVARMDSAKKIGTITNSNFANSVL